MVKQLNRVIAMLLTMTLILSMGLALGTSQARYEHSLSWQSVYYPPEPKVTSNRLSEDGALVLLKDWVLSPEDNTRQYEIKFYATTDNIYGLFSCSANLDCVEASLSQQDLKQQEGLHEITLTISLMEEAYLLTEEFPVSIHVSLQTVGDYNKQLWADFSVNLIPESAQEETTAPTEDPDETTAPVEEPEETTAPVEEPEETTAPVEEPEETTAPVEEPEETTAPVEEPEETTAPVEEPEETTAPVEEPEETTAPVEESEEVTAPSGGTEETEATTANSEETTEDPVTVLTLDDGEDTTVSTEAAENETTPAETSGETDASEEDGAADPSAEQESAEEDQPLIQVEDTHFSWGEWMAVKIVMPEDAEWVELLYNGSSFPAGTMCRRENGVNVIFGDPMTIQLSAAETKNWDILLNFKNIADEDKTKQMSVTASASSSVTRQILDTQTVTLDGSRVDMENVFPAGSQVVIAGSGETWVYCDWNDEQMDWYIEHLVRGTDDELVYVRADDQFGLQLRLESWTEELENGETEERKAAVIGNPDGTAAPGSYRLVLSRSTGGVTYTAELPFFVHYKVFATASEETGGVSQ